MSATDITFFIPEIFNQILINRHCERVSKDKTVKAIVQCGRNVQLLQLFPFLLASKTAFRHFLRSLTYVGASETLTFYIFLINGYPCLYDFSYFDMTIAQRAARGVGTVYYFLKSNHSAELKYCRMSSDLVHSQDIVMYARLQNLEYFHDTSIVWRSGYVEFDHLIFACTKQVVWHLHNYEDYLINMPAVKQVVLVLNTKIDECFEHFISPRTTHLTLEFYKVNIKRLIDFDHVAGILSYRKNLQQLHVAMTFADGQANRHFEKIVTEIPNLIAAGIQESKVKDVQFFAEFFFQLPRKTVQNLVEHNKYYTTKSASGKYFKMVSQHHRNLYYVCHVYVKEEVANPVGVNYVYKYV